jgi:predicted 2-oxoglutarate/Fe(II)-dependent dioxygenase YbiX
VSFQPVNTPELLEPELNFWPGRIAPDFLLQVPGGTPVTFYERYCGKTTVLLFARDARTLAPLAALGSRTQLLAICPAHGTVAPGDLPILRDEGSIIRAFLGQEWLDVPVAIVLRPSLTIEAILFSPSKAAIEACLAAIPVDVEHVCTAAAPVLMVPSVLPSVLCKRLMAAHDEDNFESGLLRDRDGKVSLVADPKFKRRRDHRLTDRNLVEAVTTALAERLLPVIGRAFHYAVTRMEAYKVVAYDAAVGGYFRLHRDNLSPDARHRRFALSLNLNANYEGGELVFPEFGATLYRPPAGGAVVFSGTLLHAARDVTEGRRYALLTFLWGEEAA